MLELNNIVKDYISGDTRVTALKGINLRFRDSEFVSILGQSGCGKTTFLKTLNRMVEEEGGYLSGTITLDGTDIKSLP